MALLEPVVSFLVDTIGQFGYWGILALMFLESSFFPFPSEVVIIPAGYLAFQGEMNLLIVILLGTLGSLLGAVFNYFLAMKLGRSFLLTYGKYFFFTPKHLIQVEEFFAKYGAISTFTARLVIGIRQYISLPAGLARMPMLPFCLFTVLGSCLWVSFLAGLGYFLGDNEALIKEYLQIITFAIVAVVIVVAIWFVRNIFQNKVSP